VKEQIRAEVEAFVAGRQRDCPDGPPWRVPLVGFASAADPIFRHLRRAVSPSHAMPQDLLAGAGSVVAFFVPFSRAVAAGNVPGTDASASWARAFIRTNELIGEIGERLREFVESRGYRAAVTPATHNFDPERLVSDWSHRHVAYAAGLGTFGLNRMLITEAGCCGRLGSLVVSVDLPPDPRPASPHCLERAGLPCGRCVGRCVGAALFPDRFDRHACYRMCLRNEGLHAAMGKADVCGKCLVGLPCSLGNPVRPP
jgi:epoxyqueuosine reductase QueG